MPIARRDLAEVPGGAVFARSEHAADRRHSAGAGLETAADSLGTPLLKTRGGSRRQDGAGRPAALRLAEGIRACFRGLSIDMIEVGESTGALPAMLTSVAEFYEEDVNTRMTAALSLIEPAIMIFMGIFVAFVLISLYLPIFSLADTIRDKELTMATTDQIRFRTIRPQEIAQAARPGGALPLRVRRSARSPHRPRSVPLHPRRPDVPLQLRADAGAERHARHRARRSAQPEPDRRAGAAAATRSCASRWPRSRRSPTC